jgi:hypothetical protein
MRRPPERAPQMLCNDCGVDVVEIGELYMSPPEVWNDELGLGSDDNLCIGCLEARLGREVRLIHDILPPGTNYQWMKPPSDRMADRLGFIKGRNGKWRQKTARKVTKITDKQIQQTADTVDISFEQAKKIVDLVEEHKQSRREEHARRRQAKKPKQASSRAESAIKGDNRE